MKKVKKLKPGNKISSTILVIVLTVLISAPCSAAPSKRFTKIDGEKYDDWKICRNRAEGRDGYLQLQPLWREFRPAVAFESLGANKDIAYRLGAELAEKYPHRNECARRIFAYVRDNVRYMTDQDNYGMTEFVANADESALAIETHGYQKGDCEDMAFLLAAMFQGAGFRSAILVVPDHVTVMVHLPGYWLASMDWSFNDEPGWIWAEPTGRNNYLGWTPEHHIRSEKLFYELSAEPRIIVKPPFEKSIQVDKKLDKIEVLLQLVDIIGGIILMIVVFVFLVQSGDR